MHINKELISRCALSLLHLLAKTTSRQAISAFFLTSAMLMPSLASAQVLFDHTPVALSGAGGNSTDGGNVFYVSPVGIRHARFDAASNSWSTSTSYINRTPYSPETWDTSLVGLSWWLRSYSWEKVNLFINEGNNSNRVLENYMWRDQAPAAWNYRSSEWSPQSYPSVTDFYPKTAFEHNEALNFFGTDQPGHLPYLPAPAGATPARRLKEMFWNTQRWYYTNFGNPVSNSDPSPILLGPQGAAFHHQRNPAFAAVAITQFRPPRGNVPQQPEIAAFVHENNRWRWEMIEKPNTNVSRLRAPMMIMREYWGDCFYFNRRTWCSRVRRPIILVVGLNNNSNRWELYSLEREDSPRNVPPDPNYPGRENWDAEWINHGAPSNIIQNIDPNTGLPLGFNLTAYVNYENPVTSGFPYVDNSGNAVRTGPQYNIFGNADSGDVAPELISDDRGNFIWGGGFDSPVIGNRMKLNSAMVTRFPNDPNRFRLTVPVRLDNDQVWEYFWDSAVGAWMWQQL